MQVRFQLRLPQADDDTVRNFLGATALLSSKTAPIHHFCTKQTGDLRTQMSKHVAEPHF